MTAPGPDGSMAGLTVLVTGGTGGIGRATAVALAAKGARVLVSGRDPQRTAAAAADVQREAGAGAVEGVAADMSVQAEVRRLAAHVLDTCPPLDVLVNNVGGYWGSRRVTADGLEHTFALNHLAPFLLTNLLLPRLIAGSPARVVTVSSGAQALGRIHLEDLQLAARYSGQRAYNQSKLANVLFTYELARRLAGTGVTANALHPGVVRTAFGAEDRSWLVGVMTRIAGPFLKTPEQGAATSVYLASSPEVEGVTGRYFVGTRERRSARASYDEALAAKLWRASAELVGIDPETSGSASS